MLDAQLKRGLLEVCVLAAVCREPSYGYRIIRDLSGCVEISESTLYPILRRLEGSGALEAYSVEHSGRLRRFYRLTGVGRAQMEAFLSDWPEMETMHAFVREAMG